MDPARAAYDEVYADVLVHGGPRFPLQHIVDAFAAQAATPHSKPIAIVFALLGLYLHLDKGYSGRQVQRVHMRLGRQKHPWPAIPIPSNRGRITAADVLAAPAGPDRDAAIDRWCRSVWNAYRDSHDTIIELLRQHRIV